MQNDNVRWAGYTALALGMVCLGFPALAGDVRTVEVQAKEFQFEPSTIEAEAGERLRIELVNSGKLSHNLHLEGGGVSAKTDTIQADNATAVTFTVPEAGPIEFFCNVPGHKQAGMTGKVVIK